jgi:hypothetical protein
LLQSICVSFSEWVQESWAPEIPACVICVSSLHQ